MLPQKSSMSPDLSASAFTCHTWHMTRYKSHITYDTYLGAWRSGKCSSTTQNTLLQFVWTVCTYFVQFSAFLQIFFVLFPRLKKTFFIHLYILLDTFVYNYVFYILVCHFMLFYFMEYCVVLYSWMHLCVCHFNFTIPLQLQLKSIKSQIKHFHKP